MGLVQSAVQAILSDTTIALSNTTMWPCAGLYAELNNQMSIHVPPGVPTFGVLDVQMYEFMMSMTVSSCDGTACEDAHLGYFYTPAMTHLRLGDNAVTWDVGATLEDSSTLLNKFILPLFLSNKTVDLKLSADNVRLGLSLFHIPSLLNFQKLKLEKTLSCRMLGNTDSKDIPESICHSSNAVGGRRLDSSQGYSITCVPSSKSSMSMLTDTAKSPSDIVV